MKRWNGFYKGINLGGWLSQCFNDYCEERYNTFVVEEDIRKIADWNMDHVRLPIDYNVIQEEDGRFIESGFSHIDDCIRWCEKYGLNVILDIHKTKGFAFYEGNCSFFTDEKLQDMFISLWCELARRYGNKSNVAFELLNEVTALEMAEPWNDIIEKTVPKIREITKNTKIIVGGIYNNSIIGVGMLRAPIDSNMVYTFHSYSPLVFTHQGASWMNQFPSDFRIAFPIDAKEMEAASTRLFGEEMAWEFEGMKAGMLDKDFFIRLFKKAVDTAEKYDIPIYCGEYGVIEKANVESTLNWYKAIHEAFNECVIGHCAWTYKKMDFGITMMHYESILSELIKLK